jgi:hypothetical protein
MQIMAVIESPAFTPQHFADYVLGRPVQDKQAVIDAFLSDYSGKYPGWQYLQMIQ